MSSDMSSDSDQEEYMLFKKFKDHYYRTYRGDGSGPSTDDQPTDDAEGALQAGSGLSTEDQPADDVEGALQAGSGPSTEDQPTDDVEEGALQTTSGKPPADSYQQHTCKDAAAAASTESASFSAEDYLQKVSKKRGCKPSKAAKDFHHALRAAIGEAEAWGMNLKQVKPSHLKYIHERVVDRCPALKGHAREVNSVLSRVLANAKYFQQRKGSGKGKNPAPKQNVSSSGKGKNPAPKQNVSTKVGSKSKKLTQPGAGGKECEIKSKKFESSKQPGAGGKECEIKSKKFESSKQPGAGGKEHQTKETDGVVLLHDDVPIALCDFISIVPPGMYCRLKFREFLSEYDDNDIELPEPATISKKTNIWELMKNDEFLWKRKKIVKNVTEKGYAYGSKEIHVPSVSGKRVRAKSSRLDDYIHY